MRRAPRHTPMARHRARAAAMLGAPLVPGVVAPVSRDAGAYRGQLSGYHPHRVTGTGLLSGRNERSVASLRSEDLVANDWAARSLVETMTLNAVGGVGLVPQSAIPADLLGIDEETAREVGNRFEAWWRVWCDEAGFIPGQTCADLQYMALRSVLVHGDMVHVPVMLDTARTGGAFALRIQTVHPERLRTPADLAADPYVRDGVELDELGRPAAGWIANPSPRLAVAPMGSDMARSSADFRRIPYRVGHRVGLFHCFRPSGEEQFRGEPVITPALKLFRHLSDSLDYELIAQIITASFPLFIKTSDGRQAAEDYFAQLQGGMGPGNDQPGREPVYYQNYAPGQILYGNLNEEAKALVADRPGASWSGFVTFVVRAMGAVAGIPYEALLKDFSKTNYSSARAALLEAWRVYMLWRQWQSRAYCQPLFRMVAEEAWLRGYVTLPQGAPGFYEALPLWTAALWVGPGRGYIDPVKEADANIALIENGLATYGEVLGERGLSVEDVWSVRGYEDRLMHRLAPALAARIAARKAAASASRTPAPADGAEPAPTDSDDTAPQGTPTEKEQDDAA